jgi:hypothetical protein
MTAARGALARAVRVHDDIPHSVFGAESGFKGTRSEVFDPA